MLPADHIVIAVPDLAVVEQRVRRLLGLELAGGGRHDGVGTENRITPLRGSYLEFVTVVDPSLARANPFGRLVSAALEEGRLLAGWAIAIPSDPGLGLSRQHLTRSGVAVDLYGVAEVIEASERPFGLVRPADQTPPGAGKADRADGVDGVVLAGLTSRRPGTDLPVELTAAAATLDWQPASYGRLVSASFRLPDGSLQILEQHTWEQA